LGIRFRKRVVSQFEKASASFLLLCLYNIIAAAAAGTEEEKKMAPLAGPFPPGIRFVPTDQELIGYFLRQLIDGLPVPPGVIHYSDIYQTEPWNLPEGAGYYYTPRHRMSAAADRDGSRSASAHVRRTAGAGVWNGKSPLVPVYYGEEVIGHKTSLAFNLKNRSTGSVVKTGWVMEEYILHSADGQLQTRAICKIHNKNETRFELEE
ncbi:hypothetical protein BHM03_00010900, partial [Ensete ventricosum]